MSAPDMIISVKGDVSDGVNALKVVQGELNNTVTSAGKAGASFEELQAELGRLKIAASRSFDPTQLATYNAAASKLSAQLDQMAIAEDKAAVEAKAANTQFSEMSVAVNNTSVGATRLQSAITRATDPLSIAAREVNNLSRRLLYLGSAFVFTAVAEGVSLLVDFVSELLKTGNASDTAAANLSNLNDVMADANKHAGEQIADLKILYQTATDVTLSEKDRLAAVKELQKEFPDYFKNISTETILNGGAQKQYDALTLSIIKNAQAKAALDKIEELSAKTLDNAYQKQKIINAAAAESARAQDQILSSGSSGSSLTGGGTSQDIVTITKAEQQKVIEARKEAALKLVDINNKSIQDQIDFLTKFASLPSLAQVIEENDKTKAKKGKKDNPYEDELKLLEDAKDKELAKYVGIQDLELLITEKFLEDKEKLLEKYGKLEGANDLAIAQNKQKIFENYIKFVASQHIDDIVNKLPASEDPSKLAISKIDPKIKIFPTDQIIAAGAALARLEESMKNVQTALEKDLGPAFQQLFTNIIDGSGKAFETFINSLKQVLIQLAATVLKAAALAAIMSVIFPASAGGKGFAGFFNSILGIPGHAAGASNFQGGLTWVGEHGKELVSLPSGANIIPNSQLSGAGAGVQVFIPTLTLRGADQLISFTRAQNQYSRNA